MRTKSAFPPKKSGRRRAAAAAALALSGLLTITACGSNSSSGTSSSNAPSGGGANGTVGVILPETASSARWESFDKPLLQKALGDAGFAADVQNAQGDVQKFSTLADGMIAKGVKVLLIASINSEVGSAVAAKAQKAGIPTIDYDRLNLGGSSDYYVSFDNVKVGALQGQGLATALKDKPGAQVVEIEGAPTDNNATLFHQGQESVLQPLYDAGTLKLVRSQAIDDWNNQKGGTVFEQILTGNGGKVDGVVAANDGLAGAVITVLKKNGLNGKVPVTGQDATVDGLKSVLRGDQYMTVFKPIKEEADNAVKLAVALAKGDKASADALAVGVSQDPKGKREVKSVLLQPQLITKTEVKQVVDSGFVKAADVCSGDVKQACTDLGIS